ncbi:Peptidoglycan-associated lipoprotein [subsurface metagenome]
MKRLIIILILVHYVGFSSFGQKSESEIALKEYFIDAEFFLAQEFYIDALNDYLQVYRRGYDNNANINYRIGICYLNIPGQKEKSIQYFETAKTSVSAKYRESSLKEKNAAIDVYLYLGNAYRVNNRLDDAIRSYKEYKKLLPENESNLHKYADQQIEACNIASEFMKHPIDVEFSNLGPVINNSGENYKAVVSGDGSVLVYMNRLPFYDAVSFSRNIGGEWSEPENITPQIMSDGNQFVTSLSYDGTMLLLTKEDEFNSDVLVSHYVDNRWTKSELLGSNINTKYWESHACISKDGKTLYFTSNRKGGIGDMDIYVSHLTAEGKWGPAINLGTDINTKLNEDTPFITEDGQQLYFGSQGFTSMGGYDIFESKLEGEGKWSVPENLGFPINTTDDDLFYYPWNNGVVAYMEKIQEDSYGATDIYKVIYPLKIDESIAQQVIPVDTKPDTTTGIIPAPLTEMPESSEIREEPEQTLEIAEVKTIAISPVFFGFDKSILTEKGKEELHKIVDLLRQNSHIRVELIGYTDPLGPAYYNVRLAEKRAVSAMNFLIEQGIDADRLKAIGKGEVDFIAVNTNKDGSDNSKGRKYNRRVEFEITGVDNNTLIIKRIDPVPEHLKIQQK